MENYIPDIILASSSPRRRDILASLGWKFKVIPAYIDEKEADGESPEDMVARLAMDKARHVASMYRCALVIGADTVVAAEGRILGKPRDREDNVRMIEMLSGAVHQVYTGVAVCMGEHECIRSVSTDVQFRALSYDEIRAYANCGEGDDKAGAYAIQGRGALLVERIDGCYFNVVGLPLEALSHMMEQVGVPLVSQWGGTI